MEEKKEEKPDESVEEKKVLPELEKYWKAVNDDPTNFTGWTYLLQYVDMEVRIFFSILFSNLPPYTFLLPHITSVRSVVSRSKKVYCKVANVQYLLLNDKSAYSQ